MRPNLRQNGKNLPESVANARNAACEGEIRTQNSQIKYINAENKIHKNILRFVLTEHKDTKIQSFISNTKLLPFGL